MEDEDPYETVSNREELDDLIIDLLDDPDVQKKSIEVYEVSDHFKVHPKTGSLKRVG